MTTFPQHIIDRLAHSGVVAGFTVNDVAHALPIADALLAGGIDAIELTLRTPVAMDAVRIIAETTPEMLVGVGTILTSEAAADAKSAGAQFGVSPGLNSSVVSAARSVGLPFAPGIATPSELETAISLGCRFVKFFPAASLGGLEYMRSMAAPYRHLKVQFFPLGGVNAENMMNYLMDPMVPAVGGSWIVQQDLVHDGNWAGITARAAEVSRILKEHELPSREALGIA